MTLLNQIITDPTKEKTFQTVIHLTWKKVEIVLIKALKKKETIHGVIMGTNNCRVRMKVIDGIKHGGEYLKPL